MSGKKKENARRFKLMERIRLLEQKMEEISKKLERYERLDREKTNQTEKSKFCLY